MKSERTFPFVKALNERTVSFLDDVSSAGLDLRSAMNAVTMHSSALVGSDQANIETLNRFLGRPATTFDNDQTVGVMWLHVPLDRAMSAKMTFRKQVHIVEPASGCCTSFDMHLAYLLS